MEINWDNGIYTGEIQNGKPNGRGVLQLPNGYKEGVWANGVLRQGSQYVGDILYVGNYDEQGLYHGQGYYVKENILTLQGVWDHGKIVSLDNGERLPNCVFVGVYYGGVEPRFLPEGRFPQRGKVGRDGYAGYVVDADHYEMPLLSNAFGFKVVCAVEKHNNRWDYSKKFNSRALFFCDKSCKNMYTDAWVCKWENGDCAPLTPQEAFDINNFIHDALAYENVEDFGKIQQKFANRKFALTKEGILKGDVDENGQIVSGWLVYNHDDKQGRALYKGALKDGLPDGYGEMFYRNDAENHHYKGHFKNGLFHTVGTSGYGKASLVKQNGQDWYGVWLDGEFEGEDNGIAICGWAYERYDGKFVKSQIVKGTHSNPNDKRGKYHYSGEFLNFLPHGYGTETIGDKVWTGRFANGKRIVGNGDKPNALELFDPYVVKTLNFENFDVDSFAVWFGVDEAKFTTTHETEKLSKKLKMEVVVAYHNQECLATNSLAKELFGVDCNGSCIITSKGKNGYVAIDEKNLTKLQALLQEQIAKLQSQDQTQYALTLLDEVHRSDWDVTRETHDDYPLEADHDFFDQYYYLLSVDDERYYAYLYSMRSYKWRASRQDEENFDHAYATLKLHKIPVDLTDYEQIKQYCENQNKWSQEIKHDYVTNEERYKKLCQEGGFLPILLARLLGRTLTEKKD